MATADVKTADVKASDVKTAEQTKLKKTEYFYRLVNINDLREQHDFRVLSHKVSRYLPSPFFLDNFGFMGYFRDCDEGELEVGIYLCQTSGEETLPKPIRCRVTLIPLAGEDFEKPEGDVEFIDETKDCLRQLSYGFRETIGVSGSPFWMNDYCGLFKFTVEYVDSLPQDKENEEENEKAEEEKKLLETESWRVLE